MSRSPTHYDDMYKAKTWAYGDRPDPEFIRALQGVPRGRALDIAGGQGRHALALSALGFDVSVVDSAASGLHQAAQAAQAQGLPIHIVQADLGSYEPEGPITVVCAALFFHIPARKTALKIATTLGEAMVRSGVLYVSLPGYNEDNLALVDEVLAAAGCTAKWVNKQLVTKKDRPRLPVPRRNETRALAIHD